MHTFDLNLVTNPLALRAGLIELHGQHIALPGVSSTEVLLRGCDQRQWLKRLAAMGVRHLVVPLNGPEEDSCLYARRHPTWGAGAQASSLPEGGQDARAPSTDAAKMAALPGADVPLAAEKPARRAANAAIYDLAHRDEGVFARLQFLLKAAEEIGVMVGLSIFKVGPALIKGPFTRNSNVQGLGFSAPYLAFSKAAGLEEALLRAVDWIAAEVRGRRAVWVEVFRGLPRNHNRLRLNALEELLTRRLAEGLAGHGADRSQAHLGPWVVAPPHLKWSAAAPARAPFDVRSGMTLGQEARPQPEFEDEWGPSEAETSAPQQSAAHRPALFYFAELPQQRWHGFRDHSYLWHCALRGGWPVIPAGLGGRRRVRCWRELAQLASFARQWVEGGYLRPCPELLAPLPAKAIAHGKMAAATDGCGRYFVYFSGGRKRLGAITLATLPGAYRFYWFDPLTGRGLDRGDGLEGGTRCNVPGLAAAREAILILEQEELPDPFAIW